jgi:hypothetical protein
MDALLRALCFCGAVVAGPQPRLAHRSDLGDIMYTHERVGQGKHLLRLSMDSFLTYSDHERRERFAEFAHHFAGHLCHGRYRLADGERPSWPSVRPVYAKQFVFRCG